MKKVFVKKSYAAASHVVHFSKNICCFLLLAKSRYVKKLHPLWDATTVTVLCSLIIYGANE